MAQARTRSPQRTSPTTVAGELLLTMGVIVLLFAFYEAFWTNVASGQKQEAKQVELEQQWEQERVNPRSHHTPALGEAFAQMYIPTFGSDYAFAIVEGTDDESLLAGPGRYEASQMADEAGNFAVAGHRVGKGAPFNDLDNLNVCDAIVVETATEWITYRILPMELDPAQREQEASECLSPEQTQRVATGDYSHVQGRHITLPGDINVIYPMPGAAERGSTDGLEKVITLTTCHPQFSNAERMIVHAMQTEVTPKSDGRPAAFEEMN